MWIGNNGDEEWHGDRGKDTRTTWMSKLRSEMPSGTRRSINSAFPSALKCKSSRSLKPEAMRGAVRGRGSGEGGPRGIHDGVGESTEVAGVVGEGIRRDREDEDELEEVEALRLRAVAVLVYMRGARLCTGCICGVVSRSEV